MNASRANKEEDPDADGLNNYEEFLSGTDPRKEDTDGDGYSDGTEVNEGTNPLDPNDHPEEEENPWEIFLQQGILIPIIGAIIAGCISLAFFVVRYRLRKRTEGTQLTQPEKIELPAPLEGVKDAVIKICPACGEKIETPDTTHCSYCGTALK